MRHWKLSSIAAIGILGTCYGLPIATTLIIGLCAPGGHLSAVEWDAMLTAIVAAGVVAVLVVQYLLFVLGVGAALAMEEYETSRTTTTSAEIGEDGVSESGCGG